MSNERYARQIQVTFIGESGQQKLKEAAAAIVGVGALGSASANYLARAGVGRLILVDHDFVELSNLQRQCLYDEHDIGKLKATAAKAHLEEINSEIKIEAVTAVLDDDNIGDILAGADIVLDAVDNHKTRLVINRFCVKKGIPWVYGGVAGMQGMSMNIVPGGPCYRCLSPLDSEPGNELTAMTDGVLCTNVAIISSVQCTEALKILTHGYDDESVRKTLLFIDLKDNLFEQIPVEKQYDCADCSR